MRLIRYFLVFIAVVGSFAAPIVSANSVESRIEVPSRSDSDRASGTIRALFQVLSEQYPPDHPLTPSQRRALSGEANKFVQRYGYFTDTSGNIMLRVQFDEQAIAERVRDLVGEPVSVAGLEPALLWLVVSQGAQDLLLTQGSQGLLPDTLDQIASALSQPLVFPRDDVMTSGVVSGEDVRRVNEARLVPASAQYAASQTVVLSMSADGDQWRGDWTLLGTDDRWTSAGSLADMLQVGLTAYQGRAAAIEQTNRPIRSYGAGRDEISVAVAGIGQPTDYAWLSATLRRRFPAAVVRAVAVAGDKVVFLLGAAGDTVTVAQTMASVPELQLVVPPALDGTETTNQKTDLNYLLAR